MLHWRVRVHHIAWTLVCEIEACFAPGKLHCHNRDAIWHTVYTLWSRTSHDAYFDRKWIIPIPRLALVIAALTCLEKLSFCPMLYQDLCDFPKENVYNNWNLEGGVDFLRFSWRILLHSLALYDLDWSSPSIEEHRLRFAPKKTVSHTYPIKCISYTQKNSCHFHMILKASIYLMGYR